MFEAWWDNDDGGGLDGDNVAVQRGVALSPGNAENLQETLMPVQADLEPVQAAARKKSFAMEVKGRQLWFRFTVKLVVYLSCHRKRPVIPDGRIVQCLI